MAPAVATAPAYHPWLDEFVQVPARAFGDLLAGYARIAPYDRADAPDAARMLFGPLPAGHPARMALGPAILDWLGQRRRETPPRSRPQLQRWVREICEALEIVALLEVAGAALELRRRFAIWNEWAGRFVLSPSRDARAGFWRMLALTQPHLVQEALPDLTPLWLEICRRADADLEHRYLQIGLLGFRRAAAGQSGPDVQWVTGLAHWALATDPPGDKFLAGWLALKPLYPRSASQWRQAVGRLLATPAFGDAMVRAPAWWGGDRDFAPMAGDNFRLTGDRLRSPMPAECDAITKHIGDPWDRTEALINRLMHGHRTYVNATGDSHFFVRAAHAVGGSLIRGMTDRPAERTRKAQRLAQEGLTWEPFNRHLWGLWRDALTAAGALEAAEQVGWEAVRRDPDNAEFQNQLAHLLAGPLNRPQDADALLRETIAAFPDDPVARSQRAEVLIALRRIDEAEAVVAAAFAANAANEVTYAIQARLRSHRGDIQGAAQSVQNGLWVNPTDAVLRHFKDILASGRSLRLDPVSHHRAPPAIAPAPEADDPALDSVIRLGDMRRLRSRAESDDATERDAALADVRRILETDPTFAYAELLATRYGLAINGTGTMPVFAVAFEQALTAQDQTRLGELALQQPRLEALILLAKALLGDANAAWTVAYRLNEEPPKHEARPVAFLRARLMPILGNVDRKNAASVVAANQNAIRRWLNDAIESTLGEPIAA
jgi:tetratricopeptide (TPR) repeat protein